MQVGGAFVPALDTELPVYGNFSITAQAGLRYIAELDGDDRDIGGLGLSRVNDDAKRISVPVSIAARWDF